MLKVPLAAYAWGPDRPSYTLNQLNNGILDDKIVFNSISDNPYIGHEFNFVSARDQAIGDHGLNNIWYDAIDVEPGKTYLIRLFVHNNSPLGLNAVAKDVIATFNIPTAVGKSIEVNGFIDSSNATPKRIWDNVFFQSNKDFCLRYVEGSALLENNGLGSGGGISLSDSIVTHTGVLIGYDELDGLIPGCFQYACYICILVQPVFVEGEDENSGFMVETSARSEGERQWKYTHLQAEVGEILSFQIHYRNLGNISSSDVSVSVLPTEELKLKLISGTTFLYKTTSQDGIKLDNTITSTGVNIGDYEPNDDGYVSFDAIVEGSGTLTGVVDFESVKAKTDTISINTLSDNILSNEPNPIGSGRNPPITEESPSWIADKVADLIIGLVLLGLGALGVVFRSYIKALFSRLCKAKKKAENKRELRQEKKNNKDQ